MISATLAGMYRVTRTFAIATRPPRFESAQKIFITRDEAEDAYVRACHIAGTERVCLDERHDGHRWKLISAYLVTKH